MVHNAIYFSTFSHTTVLRNVKCTKQILHLMLTFQFTYVRTSVQFALAKHTDKKQTHYLIYY